MFKIFICVNKMYHEIFEKECEIKMPTCLTCNSLTIIEVKLISKNILKHYYLIS